MSFGITPAYDGSIRVPGGGRAPSGAPVRRVIHPAPGLLGSTKGPVNFAPAASAMTSPGRALFSAACTSPPAGTAIVLPDGGT